MQKKMGNEGFSLVELIIVIAIMAILVGVLAPQFIKYVESSRQSTDIQNATSIKSAIEAYVAEETDAPPASNITVSVSGSYIVVSNMSDAKLQEIGLSAATQTKSGGWPTTSAVGTYDVSTYKWSQTTCSNTKTPGKDLSIAFK